MWLRDLIDYFIIRTSGGFDPAYYLLRYRDCRLADVDPLWHFVRYGWKEGRNPSANFDTEYYLKANPDVRQAGINPLVHYLRYGQREGRLPRSLSSPSQALPISRPRSRMGRLQRLIYGWGVKIYWAIPSRYRYDILHWCYSHLGFLFTGMPDYEAWRGKRDWAETFYSSGWGYQIIARYALLGKNMRDGRYPFCSRVSSCKTPELFSPQIRPGFFSQESVDPSWRFEAFLEFEVKVSEAILPIPAYDPYLIRYGEYRFALEMLNPQPTEVVLDIGCGANIFAFFLSCLGVQVMGVDIDPRVGEEFYARKGLVERAIGREIAISFKAEDATRLSLEPASVDKVVAISSIEHMFSPDGPGDQLALRSIARVLRPGGLAVITLPMSGEGEFHESPGGDARYRGPYRLYTPAALQERILSQPELEVVHWGYLAYTTPGPYDDLCFYRFWLEYLPPVERQKWAWANSILAMVFNPIVSQEEGERRLAAVNTALLCLRKKGSG